MRLRYRKLLQKHHRRTPEMQYHSELIESGKMRNIQQRETQFL